MKTAVTLLLAGFLVCVIGFAPQSAEAKKTPETGTHFIGELSTGVAFGTGFSEGGVGLALRSTLGVGGGFKGFPPRFYLVAAFRYSHLGATVENGTLVSEIGRDLIDLSLGLRILLPFHRLRVLAEFGLGDSILLSHARLNGREDFDTQEQRFALYVATGAQYRLHRNFSLGLLLEWAIPTSRNIQDFVAEVSGVQDTREMQGWTSITATMVGHF